jgi:ribonucleotide monophosphatase NagD (HAD superfamily)
VRAPERLFDGYVFDLDGTVYLGDELLPETRETLDELKRLSSVVYLTNKPLEMPADYAAKLTCLPRRPSLLQTGRTT